MYTRKLIVPTNTACLNTLSYTSVLISKTIHSSYTLLHTLHVNQYISDTNAASASLRRFVVEEMIKDFYHVLLHFELFSWPMLWTQDLTREE
jgi:hypothetical protein